LFQCLNKIKFFADREIPADSYNLIANALQYEFFRKGDIVFEKGSIGDKFYIILHGEVGKYSFT
jgi:CRP-like cAMP-binding protein